MPDLPHLAFAREHVMIACAPNGARRTTEDHAALPLTPETIAAEAASLPEAGVSMIHLHIRDAQGHHSLNPEIYRQAIRSIKREVGDKLVIQITTEAVGRYTPAQQMAVVNDLCPEAVSLALGELCPDETAEPEAGKFFESLRPSGIWPQYILYSPAQIQRFDQLRRKGFFGEDHPSCLLVLGNYVDQVDGNLDHLQAMLDSAETDNFPWSACCFGRGENEVLLGAVDRDGHVRLGFENNLWLPDGSYANDNTHLIQHFTRSLKRKKRPASADQIRSVFYS